MLIVENLPIHNLIGPMSDDEFYHFCRANADLRIERDGQQNIIIMSPVNTSSGHQEGELFFYLKLWTIQDESGLAFGSDTGFTLPNGAVRSPDAAWLSLPKWQSLDESDREKFSKVVPEFVIELRSKTALLVDLQAKCQEWIENGVQLLWLIDPQTETSWIYRTDGSMDETQGFNQFLSGEDVLPGFQFDLTKLYLPS